MNNFSKKSVFTHIGFIFSYILVIAISIPVTGTAQDFEVVPVALDFNVEPNESETKEVLICNHSNKKTAFALSAADFYKNKKVLLRTLLFKHH